MSRIISPRSSARVSQIRNRRTEAKPRALPPVASRDAMRAREWHNPLRHLTLSRAILLIESYPRGEFADLMWTLGAPYMGVETADADLSAILSRRCSALSEMDWNATPMQGDRIKDAVLAREQADAIHTLMDGIENLYEAIDHLQVALNRGFAHCEIVEGIDGTPVELRPVDQWHVVRDGIYGDWRYNPEARQTNYDQLGATNDMDPTRFVLRTVPRPVGRIALIKFVRSNLSEADWGAFVERYGLPSGVVTMPPDVSPEDEAAFLAAAQDVAEGGSGALPNGSEYTPNSGDKGSGAAPFQQHLDHWQKKLVLVGTGGKLTMLTESGSGTLAGGAHADTFDQLARGDARTISELIQKQLVVPWLRKQFPGEPISAAWALAFREEVDGSAVVEDATKLKGAGYTMDPAELGEKTGYKLTSDAPDPPKIPAATPEGGVTTVQIRANRPGAGAPDLGAGQGTPPENRVSGAKLNNRETEGTPGETVDPGNGEKPALENPLERMLADLLKGGVEAWEEALVEGAGEGIEGFSDSGVQETEPKKPAAKKAIRKKTTPTP